MKIEITPDEVISFLETLNNRMFVWLKEANTVDIVKNKEIIIRALEQLKPLGYTIEDGEVVKLQEEEDK